MSIDTLKVWSIVAYIACAVAFSAYCWKKRREYPLKQVALDFGTQILFGLWIFAVAVLLRYC